MCVALPAQVVKIEIGAGVVRTGVVIGPGGESSSVDLTLLPDVTVGDYVIVHSGYAISTMTPSQAAELQGLLGVSGSNDD